MAMVVDENNKYDERLNDIRAFLNDINKRYKAKTKYHRITLSDFASFFRLPIDQRREEDYRILKRNLDNLYIEIIDRGRSLNLCAQITTTPKGEPFRILINTQVKNPSYQIDNIYNAESDTPEFSKATFTRGKYKMILEKSNVATPQGCSRKIEIKLIETEENSFETIQNYKARKSLSTANSNKNNSQTEEFNILDSLLEINFNKLGPLMLPFFDEIITYIQNPNIDEMIKLILRVYSKEFPNSCVTPNKQTCKSKDLLTQNEKDIIRLIYIGYSYKFISNYLKIPYQDLINTIRDLINRDSLTQSIIDQARVQRENAIKNTIIRLSTKGYSLTRVHQEISRADKEISYKSIRKMYNELIAQGLISASNRLKPLEEPLHSETNIDNKESSQFCSQAQEEENIATQSKPLSKLESIIWEYISLEGLTNEEISEKMNITTDSVYFTTNRIARKKGINKHELNQTRTEARKKRQDAIKKIKAEFLTVKESFLKADKNHQITLAVKRTYVDTYKALLKLAPAFSNYDDIKIFTYCIKSDIRLLTEENTEIAIRQLIKLGSITPAIDTLIYYTNFINTDSTSDFINRMEEMLNQRVSKDKDVNLN